MAALLPPSTLRRTPAPRAVGLLVGLFLTVPGSLAGQALQTGHLLEPLVPAGHLRLGFAPGFTSWDSRYGLRTVEGREVEEEEPLAADLTSPTGVSLFPGLAALASDLEALADQPLSSFTLGETQGTLTKNVTRLDFSAHVGVLEWLTVGATLPWVKTRSALEFGFRPDPGANLGLTPASTDNEAVSLYLQGLADAAAAASGRAESLCAQGAGSGCAAAQDLAARARDFATRATRMYFTSPFFPLAESQPAAVFSAASAALAAELAAAGIGGPGGPVFATEAVDAETFAGLPSDPAAGLQGSPLRTRDGLWEPGDLELEATVRLLDGEMRDPGASAPRLAWSVAGGAMVRLGTGRVDSVDVFVDQGTGDGQMDVEGFGFGALRVGSRLAVRALGRYGIQGSTTLLRRVAPHEALFPSATSRRTVEWTPGSYLDLTLSPRFLISETLSLAGDYRLYHKAADEYLLLGAVGDGSDPDVALLERESEVTAHQVAVGLRYSTLGLWRRGRTGAPVELSARVVHTAAGAGGRTPKSTRAELSLHLFRRLWGG